MKLAAKIIAATVLAAVSMGVQAKGPKVDYTHPGITAIDMKKRQPSQMGNGGTNPRKPEK